MDIRAISELRQILEKSLRRFCKEMREHNTGRCTNRSVCGSWLPEAAKHVPSGRRRRRTSENDELATTNIPKRHPSVSLQAAQRATASGRERSRTPKLATRKTIRLLAWTNHRSRRRAPVALLTEGKLVSVPPLASLRRSRRSTGPRPPGSGARL